jgi:hypothetical protein
VHHTLKLLVPAAAAVLSVAAAHRGAVTRFRTLGVGEFPGAGAFDVRFGYLGGARAPTGSKALVIRVS